jgi:hypothetical protein
MASLASAAALRPASAAKAPNAARRSAGRTISKRDVSVILAAQNLAQFCDLADLLGVAALFLFERGAISI